MHKHRVKYAALFLVFLGLADFAFAQVFKLVVGPDEKTRLIENERKYRIASPIYHHDLAANVVSDATWGGARYPFRTNNLGFRDSIPRQVPLHPTGRRIVLIGDSFTEGIGVAFEQTFAGLMADRLSVFEIEVLNAGVSSYSPAIYYMKLKHFIERFGLKFDHVIVFIDISDIMDEAEYYRIRDDKIAQIGENPGRLSLVVPIKRFLKLNSLIVRFLYTVKVLYDARELGIEERRGRWTIDDKLFASYGAEGLRWAGKNMGRLYDLLDANEIRMAVVVYPWPDQVMARDLDSRQVRFWREWSRAHQVKFVNLFPQFLLDKDAERVIRKYFIPGDVHWNENGHRVVADRVLEKLETWLRKPDIGLQPNSWGKEPEPDVQRRTPSVKNGD